MTIGGHVNAGGDLIAAEGDATMTKTSPPAPAGAKTLTDQLDRELRKPAAEQDAAAVAHLVKELKTHYPQVLQAVWQAWKHPLQTLGIVWEELTAPNPDQPN